MAVYDDPRGHLPTLTDAHRGPHLLAQRHQGALIGLAWVRAARGGLADLWQRQGVSGVWGAGRTRVSDPVVDGSFSVAFAGTGDAETPPPPMNSTQSPSGGMDAVADMGMQAVNDISKGIDCVWWVGWRLVK